MAEMNSQAALPIPSRSLTLLALFPLIDLPRMYFHILVRESLMILASNAKCSIDPYKEIVVATTHQNSTHSLLTSAKLLTGYLVVEITRELNKELLLYCSFIYINTMWSMLQ